MKSTPTTGNNTQAIIKKVPLAFIATVLMTAHMPAQGQNKGSPDGQFLKVPEHNANGPTDYKNPIQRGAKNGLRYYHVTICEGTNIGPWDPYETEKNKTFGGVQSSAASGMNQATPPAPGKLPHAEISDGTGGPSILGRSEGDTEYTIKFSSKTGKTESVIILVHVIKCDKPYKPGERGINTNAQALLESTASSEGDALLIGVVLPNDSRPGDTVTGTVVRNPKKYEDVPGLHVIETTVPKNTTETTGTTETTEAETGTTDTVLQGVVVDMGDGIQQQGDKPLTVKIPEDSHTIPLTVTRKTDQTTLVKQDIPLTTGTETGTSQPESGYKMPSLLTDSGLQEITGHLSGDGSKTMVAVDGTPAQIVAITPRALIWQAPKGTKPGKHTVTLQDGANHAKFPTSVMHLSLSAPKPVLTKGEATLFTATLTGPETLPASAWKHSSVPSSVTDMAKLKSTTPGFSPPKANEKGSILLRVENASPETVSMAHAGGNVQVIKLEQSSFSKGAYVYHGSLHAVQTGGFKIIAQAVAFLDTVENEEDETGGQTDGGEKEKTPTPSPSPGETPVLRTGDTPPPVNHPDETPHEVEHPPEEPPPVPHMSETPVEYPSPGPHTTSSPTPPPLSEPSPTFVPPHVPPPGTPPKYLLEKRFEDINAVYEPVQGVWQDDEFFKDFVGKQLNPAASVTASVRTAELKMVVDRKTVINGGRDSQHNTIFISGMTNCTTEKWVKLRFILNGKTVYEEDHCQKKILVEDPKEGYMKEFRYEITAPEGVPPVKDLNKFPPFAIPAGDYNLEAELVLQDGTPTGIAANVKGTAVVTKPPTLCFMPCYLGVDSVGNAGTPVTPETQGGIEKDTKDLEKGCSERIPDFYPLSNAVKLPTRDLPFVDFADKWEEFTKSPDDGKFEKMYDKNKGSIDGKDPGPYSSDKAKNAGDSQRRPILKAFITDFLDAGAKIAEYERVVAVFPATDFNDVFYKDSGSGSTGTNVATALSQKVICVADNPAVPERKTAEDPVGNVLPPPYWVVSHEVVHTLPFEWADEQMMATFGFDYHQGTDVDANPRSQKLKAPLCDLRNIWPPTVPPRNALDFGCGNGLQIVEKRGRKDGVREIMGRALRLQRWIGQGTYWHVLDAFSKEQYDPPMLLVRGFLAKSKDQVTGTLFPSYHVMGTPDLEAVKQGTNIPAEKGAITIVFLGAGGKELARYPFVPEWAGDSESETPSPVIAFDHWLPLPSEPIENVELLAPDGRLLDSLKAKPRPPELHLEPLVSPVAVPAGAAKLPIHWTGGSKEDAGLVYSVSYSTDGGKKWVMQALDTAKTTADIPVLPEDKEIRVRVVASSGILNTEAIASFPLKRK